MTKKLDIISKEKYAKLTPNDQYAYDNCEYFILWDFINPNRETNRTRYEAFDTMMTVAQQMVDNNAGRPILYAAAMHPNGFEVICQLPVDIKRQKVSEKSPIVKKTIPKNR